MRMLPAPPSRPSLKDRLSLLLKHFTGTQDYWNGIYTKFTPHALWRLRCKNYGPRLGNSNYCKIVSEARELRETVTNLAEKQKLEELRRHLEANRGKDFENTIISKIDDEHTFPSIPSALVFHLRDFVTLVTFVSIANLFKTSLAVFL
jgi:hypothetical protein